MERFVLYATLVGSALLMQRIYRFLCLPHHVGEPPILSPSIPLVGHLLGMLRHGSYYYSVVSNETTAPIFTMRVPGGKIYVVKSPRLASQVDRNTKDISFSPYVMMFAERILASSKEGLKALSVNLRDDAREGCLAESRKVMHDTMSPGEDLAILAKDIATHMWPHLASLERVPNGGKVQMHEWLRHVVCLSSTDAVWGPKSPFQDPVFEQSFWAILEQFAYLGLNFFPTITARKGYQGREIVFDGFRKFYAENGQREASPLVQSRFGVNKKFDISIDDIAKYDLSVATALLINSSVAAFWCTYELYSRPQLLAEIREGITRAARKSPSDEYLHVDIDKISSKAPQLEAFIRELLRLKAYNISGRVILHDTTLEGGYLLKKDSMLLVPSAGLHADPNVWGKDAEDFNPTRFLKEGGIRSGVPASSHRTFGGGSALCPGRHVFMTEIMVLMVILVLKYEIEPVGGAWMEIEGKAHISRSFLAPAKDIEVCVTERRCDKENKWKFYWADIELGAVS
ncbi:cytochrome P450 [Plenodomus tracheiphilus IPT5]|uniref:Cytochrome P450 n=1 Tax=Plenodomus tracheiphilus IPT5 TaxID=1408161 RepID=A0A6A7AWV5_9PLEO|nr:cytochrome P450 [Plenodomus tracheiphilus IPT5]